MAAVTICSVLEPKKIKSVTVSFVSPSICHELMGLNAMIFVFWKLNFKPASSITLLFHFHQETLQFLLTFWHKGGVICIPEVIAISLSNLDSRLCFNQPSIFMMYSAYKLSKQGDTLQPWRTPFPIRNLSIVPCLVLTFLLLDMHTDFSGGR